MLVKAIQGARCPKEGKPREYITDSTPEEVPESIYYRRLVTDGSLVIAVADSKQKKADKQ